MRTLVNDAQRELTVVEDGSCGGTSYTSQARR